MKVCTECAKPILWVRTINDVAMPLDREPCPAGNIILAGDVAHRIPSAQLPIEDQDAYTCHLDTCTRRRDQVPVPLRPRCQSCGLGMDPVLAAAGDRTHPCC